MSDSGSGDLALQLVRSRTGPSGLKTVSTVTTADFANPQASVTPVPTRAGLTLQAADLARGMNFGDVWDPSSFSSTDPTVTLQSFIRTAQNVAYAMSRPNLDGLLFHADEEVLLPRGLYMLSSPMVLAANVRFSGRGILVSKPNAGGGSVASWDGSSDGQALSDLYQPIAIAGYRSDIPELNIFANWSTGLNNSGLVIGKSWTAASVSLVSGGTGYQVNDVVYLAQPSIVPYYGASVKVTTVDGNGTITAFTFLDGGAYELPPAQQALQWTSAAGYLDRISGAAVFASGGVYNTTGQSGSAHGTGATFGITWQSDFVNTGGDTSYYGGLTNKIDGTFVIGDTHIERYRYSGLLYGSFGTGRGASFGIMWWGYNHTFGNVETSGGNIGIYVKNVADLRGGVLNAVNASIGLQVLSSSSIECSNVVLDTCTINYLKLDNSSLVVLRGTTLVPSTRSGPSGAMFNIGSNTFFTAGSGSTALNLDFTCYLTGSNSPGSNALPGIGAYLARARASRVKFNFVNSTPTASPYTVHQATVFAVIGPDWLASNLIEGQIDNCAGPLFGSAAFTGAISGNTLTVSGTPIGALAVGHEIWAGGTYYGVINALGTGSGGTGTYTLDTTQGSVVVAVAMKSLTVIFPAAGGIRVWDGATNGWCRDAGLYEITGSTAPTASTGLGKARQGSTYVNTSTGQRYTNTGTHITPSWS